MTPFVFAAIFRILPRDRHEMARQNSPGLQAWVGRTLGSRPHKALAFGVRRSCSFSSSNPAARVDGVLECWSTAQGPNCIRRGGLGMLKGRPKWCPTGKSVTNPKIDRPSGPIAGDACPRPKDLGCSIFPFHGDQDAVTSSHIKPGRALLCLWPLRSTVYLNPRRGYP